MAAAGSQPQACDVCERTILKGERTREYVSTGGEKRAVCDLCRARVEAAGWVRADRLDEQAPASRREGRAGASRWIAERASRMRARIEQAREPAGDPQPESPPPPPPPRASAPNTPERRLRRALDGFNGSEHRRTVAGLTRSLGEPRVSAVSPPDAPDDVRLTVAWDLSWYQWGVRLSDEGADVRALAKGAEVGELADPDRAWNARATDDGELQLAAERDG